MSIAPARPRERWSREGRRADPVARAPPGRRFRRLAPPAGAAAGRPGPGGGRRSGGGE